MVLLFLILVPFCFALCKSEGLDVPGDDSLAGLIILHGLGVSMGPDIVGKAWTNSPSPIGIHLSSRTIVRTPKAERKPVHMLPPTLVPGLQFARSWFDFWMMPGLSVLSPVAGESKEDLEAALGRVEQEIEYLLEQGVPSRNIVVAGLSQGGAVTIYTALHTRYKLGGFVPIVAWLPLRKTEPITSLPTPVNRDTPILHINGLMDPIVPVVPAGLKTKEEMNKVFTNYEFKAMVGTHTTTIPNPLNVPRLKSWLRENTNLKFRRGLRERLMDFITG